MLNLVTCDIFAEKLQEWALGLSEEDRNEFIKNLLQATNCDGSDFVAGSQIAGCNEIFDTPPPNSFLTTDAAGELVWVQVTNCNDDNIITE